MNLENYHVILASNSPRRKELLRGLGINFEVRTLPDIDESYPDTLQRGDIPLYISREKADAYRASMAPDELVITADTIVWLHGEVLGKPADEAEARAMLRKLSGRAHEVVTAVTIRDCVREETFSVSTQVHFEPLTQDEIDYYIDKYKPFDKAGAYGIQEWIGYVGISSIEGSFYNVMGFPVHRVWHELQSFL